MKKETKASLIIFIVVFIIAYVMACFIPDEILNYSTQNGSILSCLGDGAVALIGMRGILALAIALITTLLIRIVDSGEKNSKSENSEKKSTAKKATKKADKNDSKEVK